MAEPHTPYSTPEPEKSSSPEPEGTYPGVAAEPLPEWAQATATWKWGWDVHWAGLGCLFLLLAVYAAWSVVCVIREKKRKRRVMSIFISSLLFLFGLSRALFLFINPYESPECHVTPKCHMIVTRILFAIGLPCLTAAFSFIHLVFLQVIKLKLYPGRVQNWKFLLLIVAIHFLLAFFIELMIYLYADWLALSLICQVFYIVFSIVLSTSFWYTGQRIIKHVNQSALHVSRMGTRTVGSTVVDKSRRHPNRRAKPYTPNVSKLVKITYLTASLGLLCCALQLYSIFGIYNMYKSENFPKPKPIPWLVFQSLFRLVEILAGITMAYVSPRQTKQWSRLVLPWLPSCFGTSCTPAPAESHSLESCENTSQLSISKVKILDLQNVKADCSNNSCSTAACYSIEICENASQLSISKVNILDLQNVKADCSNNSCSTAACCSIESGEDASLGKRKVI